MDASVVLELLLRTTTGERAATRVFGEDVVHAPHLLDLEVTQVLRRYAMRGEIEAPHARSLVGILGDLPISRNPHQPLLERIWELRQNITAYDAAYVALAEGLRAPLVTTDARLAAASGHRARIELL